MTRTGRGDEGQATVELALVLPLVAVLLLVALQVGLVLRDHVLVGHAAREAVRAAAVAEDDRTGAATRAAERAGPLASDDLHLRVVEVEGGEAVRVELDYESSTDVPLVGTLLPDVRLSASATMRVETGPRRG